MTCSFFRVWPRCRGALIFVTAVGCDKIFGGRTRRREALLFDTMVGCDKIVGDRRETEGAGWGTQSGHLYDISILPPFIVRTFPKVNPGTHNE